MERKNCLICCGTNLRRIFDLGMHPYADTFVPKDRLGDAIRLYPLVVDLCETCGQVQTAHETSADERYAAVDYSYTSANSSYSRNHWDQFAKELQKRLGSNLHHKRILEIGSNDGFLLQRVARYINWVQGWDASPAMAKLARDNGVPTECSIFDLEAAAAHSLTTDKYDAIVANNVFNHANQPLDFALGVATLLKRDGLFVFEQPYWLETVKSGQLDQVYHEHVSYFTIRMAAELLKKVGMKIFDVEWVDYHGGSLRIYAQHVQRKDHASSSLSTTNNRIGRYISQERDILDRFDYAAVNEKLDLRRNKYLAKLYELRRQEIPIVLVGAAAKGNTFINYCNLDYKTIDFVTDVSEHKQGKYTPASCIPIVEDEILKTYDRVAVTILSWNIAHKLKPILDKINPNITYLEF